MFPIGNKPLKKEKPFFFCHIKLTLQEYRFDLLSLLALNKKNGQIK